MIPPALEDLRLQRVKALRLAAGLLGFRQLVGTGFEHAEIDKRLGDVMRIETFANLLVPDFRANVPKPIPSLALAIARAVEHRLSIGVGGQIQILKARIAVRLNKVPDLRYRATRLIRNDPASRLEPAVESPPRHLRGRSDLPWDDAKFDGEFSGVGDQPKTLRRPQRLPVKP